ncbi:hypothetical protein DPMN_022296 [Dreissena polymorpha]|uniref:Uncharacterized protein n=1 Tax=Dreissena polymorpha TaxID=45954 RepID=A0A9D4SCD0_DREPO|nr:hypothetical protein DPMN_022296 [Dreissena polymorpha]
MGHKTCPAGLEPFKPADWQEIQTVCKIGQVVQTRLPGTPTHLNDCKSEGSSSDNDLSKFLNCSGSHRSMIVSRSVVAVVMPAKRYSW